MTVALFKWDGLPTLREALEAIDAWEDLRPGMTVLIKPNAVMGGSPKIACTGITTSPTIVGEIIRLVREQGAGKVIIAEGSVELPTLKLDTAAAFKWSGIQAVAERESVSLVLAEEGYETSIASNGKEALDLLNASDFDVLITDLKMPEMGGMELIKQCLKICPQTSNLSAGIFTLSLIVATSEFKTEIEKSFRIQLLMH